MFTVNISIFFLSFMTSILLDIQQFLNLFWLSLVERSVARSCCTGSNSVIHRHNNFSLSLSNDVAQNSHSILCLYLYEHQHICVCWICISSSFSLPCETLLFPCHFTVVRSAYLLP
jgi:hypothetical protein